MKTVLKFPIPLDLWGGVYGGFLIPMPPGSKVIHAGADPNGTPCLWAECERSAMEAEYTPLTFEAIGTGKGARSDAVHLSSFSLGSYVWHVFSIA